MKRVLLISAISVLSGSLLSPSPAKAQLLPPAARAARVQITQGPELELANGYLTIIRWTTNNPGGSDEHFGVVQYGTDPKHLNATAKSHIRLNRGHSYAVLATGRRAPSTDSPRLASARSSRLRLRCLFRSQGNELYDFRAQQVLMSEGQQTPGVSLLWADAACLACPNKKQLHIWRRGFADRGCRAL